MPAVYDPYEVRDRIQELVEALVARLDGSGVPEAICDRLREPLRDRLADEAFQRLIVAHMAEPPSCTLERLVLAYDPRLELAELAYKN